jgi:colicin import membrane protein
MATMRRGGGLGSGSASGKDVAGEGSSVLFSLGELMKIEEERVDEERHRADHQRAEMERARALAEVRAAREEEARIGAERARAAAEAKLEREENARHDAMRVAAVERARIEAEESARLAAMTAAQAHERSLAELREDASKKSLSRWLKVAIVGGVLVIGGGLGLYFGKIKPDAEAREQVAAAEVARAQEELRAIKKELERRELTVASLEKERDAATDAKARAELDAKIRAEKKSISDINQRIVRPPPVDGDKDKKEKKGRDCAGKDPNDPLNGCL